MYYKCNNVYFYSFWIFLVLLLASYQTEISFTMVRYILIRSDLAESHGIQRITFINCIPSSSQIQTPVLLIRRS